MGFLRVVRVRGGSGRNALLCDLRDSAVACTETRCAGVTCTEHFCESQPARQMSQVHGGRGDRAGGRLGAGGPRLCRGALPLQLPPCVPAVLPARLGPEGRCPRGQLPSRAALRGGGTEVLHRLGPRVTPAAWTQASLTRLLLRRSLAEPQKRER